MLSAVHFLPKVEKEQLRHAENKTISLNTGSYLDAFCSGVKQLKLLLKRV